MPTPSGPMQGVWEYPVIKGHCFQATSSWMATAELYSREQASRKGTSWTPLYPNGCTIGSIGSNYCFLQSTFCALATVTPPMMGRRRAPRLRVLPLFQIELSCMSKFPQKHDRTVGRVWTPCCGGRKWTGSLLFILMRSSSADRVASQSRYHPPARGFERWFGEAVISFGYET